MGSIARSLQTVHDSAWFGRIARAGYYAVRPFFVARHLIERADVAILPPEEKHAFILRTAQSLRCRYFVETGTYRGATAAYMSQHFARCYTVELDQALAARAAQLLPQFGDIRVYQGHSTAQLPKIMADLDDRALFWLDAHGNTLPKTPVLRELEIVLEDHRFDHVIMVDDARAFLGINSYPTISRVRKTVARVAPEYKIRCINDIIIVAKMSM